MNCRLPWPQLISAKEDDVPICQNLTEYIHFEKLYAQIGVVSTNSIENITRCLRPCHYKEYRMEDRPESLSKKREGFSSAFVFWFVSTEINVEEQSLVYPWQSLASYNISLNGQMLHQSNWSQSELHNVKSFTLIKHWNHPLPQLKVPLFTPFWPLWIYLQGPWHFATLMSMWFTCP